MLFLRHLRYKISVYEGISPSLLATMSLSLNIKGNNHLELIQNLQKSNLIQCGDVISALKSLDRQLFTSHQFPYENKPYPIGEKQKMTDIFTHAIILQNISAHFKQNVSILDIGTGHGYLAFTLHKMATLKKYSSQVVAIDIAKQCIQQCSNIKNVLSQEDPKVKEITFQNMDLHQYFQNHSNQLFDIIVGGFYIDENMTKILNSKLNEQGVGIWATQSDSGQALYKFQKNKAKQYIIQTLFSMPQVNTSVSKYFLSEEEQSEFTDEQNKVQQKKHISESEKIKQVKLEDEKLKALLRIELEKHRTDQGKVLTLAEMKVHPTISIILKKMGNKRYRPT